MPIGVYPHKPNQGFQKGHKGFITKEGYAQRKKPIFTEEYLEELRKVGRRRGLANKGGTTSKKGKHNPLWSAAAKRRWKVIKDDPELYALVIEKMRIMGGKGLAKLHGRYGTWIEKRFEEFLEMFGQVKGTHFLTQECVYTNVSWRYPDFLLANNVIIEVDGENWHTPEKDKLRDAELLAVGYRVFHFTGKDIKNNPIDCCDRLIEIINEVCCA